MYKAACCTRAAARGLKHLTVGVRQHDRVEAVADLHRAVA